MRVIKKICRWKKINPYHLVTDFQTPDSWGALKRIEVKTTRSSGKIRELNSGKRWHWCVAMLFENAYYCVYINDIGNLIVPLNSKMCVCTEDRFLTGYLSEQGKQYFNSGNIYSSSQYTGGEYALLPYRSYDYEGSPAKPLHMWPLDSAEVGFVTQESAENWNWNNGFKALDNMYSVDTDLINYDIDPTGHYVALGYSPDGVGDYNWICLIELSGGIDVE